MGICLGMQLLMTQSEEFGIHEGLDIIKGSVIKFPINSKDKTIKVPQVGWNNIIKPSFARENYWDSSPLKDIDSGEFMYFVHSYYVIPANKETILSITNYENTEYCSSILYKNIFACQFHPEKSGEKGIEIYRKFKIFMKNGGVI